MSPAALPLSHDTGSVISGLSTTAELERGEAPRGLSVNWIAWSSPFRATGLRIGDRIKVESIEGVVDSIGIRSTRVTNPDGHHVAIPNKIMGNAIIREMSASGAKILASSASESCAASSCAQYSAR